MSSAAALEAAAVADKVLATSLAKTKLLTAVKKLEVLSELEFEHEHGGCEQALLASVENAEKMAAGERGDRVKVTVFRSAPPQQRVSPTPPTWPTPPIWPHLMQPPWALRTPDSVCSRKSAHCSTALSTGDGQYIRMIDNL